MHQWRTQTCNGRGFVSLVSYSTNAYSIRLLWVVYFSTSMGGGELPPLRTPLECIVNINVYTIRVNMLDDN